ncbi:hypothetical protein jhhlp_000542 [Lomentospora prolificans]|uniref:Uncharacterized protein n=1 Tax=Lomentospora prolificans TaxID=41688 RepID=A0A2N3NL88_9PEZI|nr:hypothetical protein jhhlp_000542 [Lomentospora prolificans]
MSYQGLGPNGTPSRDAYGSRLPPLQTDRESQLLNLARLAGMRPDQTKTRDFAYLAGPSARFHSSLSAGSLSQATYQPTLSDIESSSMAFSKNMPSKAVQHGPKEKMIDDHPKEQRTPNPKGEKSAMTMHTPENTVPKDGTVGWLSEGAYPRVVNGIFMQKYSTPKIVDLEECVETAPPMTQVRLVGIGPKSPTPPPRGGAAGIGYFVSQPTKDPYDTESLNPLQKIANGDGIISSGATSHNKRPLLGVQSHARPPSTVTQAADPSYRDHSSGITQNMPGPNGVGGPFTSLVDVTEADMGNAAHNYASSGPKGTQNSSTVLSKELRALLNGPGGVPTLSSILDAQNFPFIETAIQVPVDDTQPGIVRVTNIPFDTGHNEVDAFLGYNSRILPDNKEPIHIVMCRITGKTLEIFVELQSMDDAVQVVERQMRNSAGGRPGRIGDRLVEVAVSNKKTLMKALFPKANGVEWTDGGPIITTEGLMPFRGFVSTEELTMLVKHVEHPHRCTFSRDCPERPFESLISLLRKFPWEQTKHIRNHQRYKIFFTTFKLIELLIFKLRRRISETRLTHRLLRRIADTAMTCRGFTVLQKDDIARLVGLSQSEVCFYGQPRYASRWRHQYAVSVKRGLPFDLIEWYIDIIAEQTRTSLIKLPVRERHEAQNICQQTDDYWGYFFYELGILSNEELEQLTLCQLAEREFATIENILRRAAKKMGAVDCQ